MRGDRVVQPAVNWYRLAGNEWLYRGQRSCPARP